MPTIAWNELAPADGDSAGQGDDQIRSLKTAIRVGLDTEHNWPSGGGDAGVHRIGSARPYYAAQSLVSSTGTDARLMQTSDTSQFFHVGSGGTSLIGGQAVLSLGTYPGAVPQRHQWVMEVGSVTASSGTATITFPNSGFSGVPFMQVTPLGAVGDLPVYMITSRSATGAVVWVVDSVAGAPINSALLWQSIGSRVL